jgi:hypothetical protein
MPAGGQVPQGKSPNDLDVIGLPLLSPAEEGFGLLELIRPGQFQGFSAFGPRPDRLPDEDRATGE